MGSCGSKAQEKDAVGSNGYDGQERRNSRGSNSSSSSAKCQPRRPSKESKEGCVDHEKFILENRGKITEFYDMDKKKIGEGSYGSVCKAKDKSTLADRAIKTIAKSQKKANLDRLKQEIGLMKMMDHPNIIKLYETFEDSRNHYLVMELCTGGELFDRIIDAGSFTEVRAATVMQQIIRAIYYMHEARVCHRDLKPENFIFQSKDPIEKATLKIIDFGLSCRFEEGVMLSTKAGTPYYVAPQVLAGSYDESSDVWSIGVIMYVLLCGYPPFYGETDAEVLRKVKVGNFQFTPADWKQISEDAKDLIRNMLKMRPKERFTAAEALRHEWIKNKAPKASGVCLGSSLVDNLRGFRSQNKLKKAALHIIASNLNEDQIGQLRDIFMALDGNGDGQLTVAELKEGIKKSGLKEIPADLQQIMQDVDSDGSGVIDYTEFLAATLDKRQFVQEDVCWAAFRVFDKNGDGQISQDELKVVLGDESVNNVMGSEVIKSLLAEVDINGDGMIDFTEFMNMMRGGNGSPKLSPKSQTPKQPRGNRV